MFKRKDKKYRLVVTYRPDYSLYEYQIYYDNNFLFQDTNITRNNTVYDAKKYIRNHKRRLKGDQVVLDKKY